MAHLLHGSDSDVLPMPPRYTAVRFSLLKVLAACAVFSVPLCSRAISFSNRYRSPRSAERPVRKATRIIVLHTTEAGARSSLNKLSERGEAHYCIDEKGVVYRIVDRNREAFHAGRSMWNGKEECDSYSIGIEVVGYHDKPITLYQIDAIKELLAILQKEYRIDDAHVVCHSHVAYGAPNKWQKRNHRGRKRCGMLFAMPSVRSRLGLSSKPAYDPDVRARRLVVGDQYLEKVLYGKVDTMKTAYRRDATPKPKPGIFATLFSKKSPDMANEPEQESYYGKPPDGAAGKPVKKTAPAKSEKVATKQTSPKPISKPSPKPRAVTSKEPTGLKDLEDRVKYRELGTLSKKSTPYRIVGRNWNASTTYYYSKGRIIRGDRLDPKRVTPGMRVFIRK